MAAIDENDLSACLLENTPLRPVEAGIFSVLPGNESGNEYDTRFGFFYDRVACNPIYNKVVWGYSVKLLQKFATDALASTHHGKVLDIGCGSLAFTAKAYGHYTERQVVLADQSLNMLKMAKARLIQQNGKLPDNLVFLHADALHLPFQENAFTTIISENLLHCLEDTGTFLQQLKKIATQDGRIYFTTLVKTNRPADRYLQALADSGKLISRTAADHEDTLRHSGLEATYHTDGNLLSILCVK